jgi:hypothetical protein
MRMRMRTRMRVRVRTRIWMRMRGKKIWPLGLMLKSKQLQKGKSRGQREDEGGIEGGIEDRLTQYEERNPGLCIKNFLIHS